MLWRQGGKLPASASQAIFCGREKDSHHTMGLKIFIHFVVLAIVALTSSASSSPLLSAVHTIGRAKKKANANLFIRQIPRGGSSASSSPLLSAVHTIGRAKKKAHANLFIHQIPRGGGGGKNSHCSKSSDDSSHLSRSTTAIQGVGRGEWWVESADLDIVTDAPLISDIEMLSNMLAEVVKRENPIVYDLYNTFRKHGMDRAALASNADEGEVADSIESFEAMKTLARDISPRDAKGVMKTFGIALNLVNSAEVHHRVRLVRTLAREASDASGSLNGGVAGPLPNVEDGICGTMEILLNTANGGKNSNTGGVDPEKIFQRLITQKCEIVLTAHPTEVNRKTLIRKCELVC